MILIPICLSNLFNSITPNSFRLIFCCLLIQAKWLGRIVEIQNWRSDFPFVCDFATSFYIINISRYTWVISYNDSTLHAPITKLTCNSGRFARQIKARTSQFYIQFHYTVYSPKLRNTWYFVIISNYVNSKWRGIKRRGWKGNNVTQTWLIIIIIIKY